MEKLTLQQAIAGLASGTFTSAELTEFALARIADEQGEGSRAFTRVYPDVARQQAQESDRRRIADRPRSALDGVPISIKDLFDIAGEPTTAGSRVLATGQAASRHAVVVERLLQAGVVVVGKTNMTEFAYSGLGINPHYGTPANPWDRASRRIPGGSSAGAAVAVADGMSLGSIGSDTGGSVRIPAAFCGLTGYKPTARRINSAGLLPLSPSLDSIGVIAHGVGDCVVLDGLIAEQPLLPIVKPLTQARFGIPQTCVLDGLDKQVAAAFELSLRRLAVMGARIETIPCTAFAELAEINASGGFTALESWRWHQELIEKHADLYDPRVLSRIRRGATLEERDRAKLIQQRIDWQQRVTAEVQGYDALLMPTVPFIAPTIAELEADDEAYFRINGAALRNPSVINFLDGCAVSLPCQLPGEAPVGLMVAGLPQHDSALLGWALSIEHGLASA
ncbi:amidase [Pectobacterium zantedeschiae]|uniref:Amidase n=1 Tax=Pectobacterium zantedeschiae TaxID=2034769 RepID=A0A9X8P6N3_9GAMM|nr:amidase [Pectobacterium zantedeschiae]RYC42508.1 amidase [Pectobacterium zantedeschiae]RYC45746.1 amidase [Pectobacterium zantedeschiae]